MALCNSLALAAVMCEAIVFKKKEIQLYTSIHAVLLSLKAKEWTLAPALHCTDRPYEPAVLGQLHILPVPRTSFVLPWALIAAPYLKYKKSS